jgi:hypothetical protein
LGSFFSPNYQNPISIHFQVPKIVTVSVNIAFFVLVDVGEKLKVEASSGKFISGGFGQIFPLRNLSLQNVSVLPNRMIDIADQIGAQRILLIVEGVSAAVITEFFIHSTL